MYSAPMYLAFKKQTQIITDIHPISHLLPQHDSPPPPPPQHSTSWAQRSEAPSLPCTRRTITVRAFHPVINHGGTRDISATVLDVLLTAFPGPAPPLGRISSL